MAHLGGGLLLGGLLPGLLSGCLRPMLAQGSPSAALIGRVRLPEFDADLARDDVIRMPVQVNGKKRAEIEVARGADRETIEGLVMASPDVARYLGGRAPRKVIVVPGRIVNVVV